MKIQRIAVLVTAINLVLMIILLTKLNPAKAQGEATKSTVLRGTGLEITDNGGKLRASITFQPAVEKDGVKYAAGILLRLIDTKGKPVVKISGGEDGGALSFSNATNGYLVLESRESGGLLRIKNADGKEKVIQP